MKKSALMFLVVALFSAAYAAAAKPNIIIMFNDDMGYADVGCFGSDKNPTPRIDKMAAEGRKFTDFYVTSSVCTPSRASLMTGCYPARVLGPSGVFFPNKIREDGMDPRHFTIAELLKSVGYKTFHAGKWHLGDAVKFLPTKQGFDSFYGLPYSNDMYPSRSMKYAADCNWRLGHSEQKMIDLYAETPAGAHPMKKHNVPLMRDEVCIEFPLDQTTITRRLADESIKFIEESVKAKKPFFLYLANPMPHVPLFVSPEFDGKTGNGLYADVIAEIDFNTGRVLDALKANGVDENTLVIFTSDNGPWLVKGEHSGSAKPLRAGKGSTYEGGHRVPCIMRWPGKIPAGTVCSEISSAMDMMPTFAAISGAKIPEDVRCKPDGHNIVNLMTGGPEEKSPYEAFYFGDGAIREGKWKYRQGNLYAKWLAPGTTPEENSSVTQLFNFADDLSETKNVIDQYPEIAERLVTLLSKTPDVPMVLHELEPPHGTRYEVKLEQEIEVDGGEGGTFEAVLAFATGTGSKCAVIVNGVEQEALGFPNTNKSWTEPKAGKFTLELKPGSNTIKIQKLAKQGINFSYLDLKPEKMKGVVEAIMLYSYGPQIWDVEGSWTTNSVAPNAGPAVTNIPGASDSVRIQNGMTITNDAACLSLTTGYKGNSLLTIATNGTLTAGSMTLSVTSGKHSTINNAGTITLSGDFSHSRAIVKVNNSGTMNIGGNLIFAGHATAAEEMYFTNTGMIAVSGDIGNGAWANWTFHMLDGTVTASNLYMNGSVTAHISLNSGTISVTNLLVNTNSPSVYTNYTIDVAEGVLIADGDNREEWNFLIDKGIFTAEGGEGALAARYSAGTGKTTLLQIPLSTVINQMLAYYNDLFGISDLSELTALQKKHDGDGDGMADWNEFWAGTNPSDSRSLFKAKLKKKQPEDAYLTVQWTCVNEGMYTVRRASGGSFDFLPVASNLVPPDVSGTMEYKDYDATGDGPYYYKVTKQ